MAFRKVQYFADAESVVLAGTITGMFKSARVQREDRWTGFFCRPLNADPGDSRYSGIRFSGHTALALKKGDVVEIYGKPRRDPKTGDLDFMYWDIVDVRRVLSDKQVVSALIRSSSGLSASAADAVQAYFGKCSVFALSYLSPSNKYVRELLSDGSVTAEDFVSMCSNARSSMVSVALKNAFPSVAATSVFSGLCQLLSRYPGDVDSFIDEVKRAPYALLGKAADLNMRFKFETVDKMAIRDCGVALDDPVRVGLCVERAFRKVCLDAGHVCWDVSDSGCLGALVAASARILGLPSFSATDLYAAVTAPGGGFFLSEYAGRTYLYSGSSHAQETRAANALLDAVNRPSLFADLVADKTTLRRVNSLVCDYYVNFVGSDAPVEAYAFVQRAIRSRVSVLTGGPGSGKTTAVKCLIYVLRELLGGKDPRSTPVLTAPTGMAAKRLQDSVNSAEFLKDVIPASTAAYWVCYLRSVFRLVDESSSDERADSILKPLREALENRLLVVDEVSMMDTEWSCEFFDYMLSRFHCQVVFIGDRDQLPSVSYGEIFEHLCMLEPDVPITTLVGSNRVAKDKHVLLENFERVNSGHVMASLDWSEPSVFDRHWSLDDEASARSLVEEYASIVGGFYPADAIPDVHVLTPVHGGALGTYALNRALQDVVNPKTGDEAEANSSSRGDEIPGVTFGPAGDKRAYRVGDDVVLTKKVDELTNGERGVIDCVDLVWSDELSACVDYVVVEFLDVQSPAGGNLRKRFTFEDFSHSFLPAYATTIHKAQGMEYDVVLMACPQAFSTPGFGVRNLPFTAMTRAKSRVSFYGREHALDAAILTKRQLRCSLLAHRVRGLVRER